MLSAPQPAPHPHRRRGPAAVRAARPLLQASTAFAAAVAAARARGGSALQVSACRPPAVRAPAGRGARGKGPLGLAGAGRRRSGKWEAVLGQTHRGVGTHGDLHVPGAPTPAAQPTVHSFQRGPRAGSALGPEGTGRIAGACASRVFRGSASGEDCGPQPQGTAPFWVGWDRR